MKSLLTMLSVLAALVTAPAFAETTYTLPNPEVATSIALLPNACSFSSATVYVSISDPTYTGGRLSGPVTQTPIYRFNAYGTPYFWGWNFKGTLNSTDGHTAQYEQDWLRNAAGGREYHCYATAYAGSISVQ
jgi:hypothetical protein